MHTAGDFVLHGGSAEFANKQKLLFDKLSDAEQECSKNKMITESTESTQDIDSESNYSQILRAGRKSQTRRFRGKESIFKLPEGPAPRVGLSRNIPDFHKNPHKWKKYSLGDVSNDDMTEESNTRAALSFLKELKARRSVEKIEKSEGKDANESDLVKRSQPKIMFKSKKQKISNAEVEFKKPESNTNETDNTSVIIENDDKPIFRSSKIIMPEYVVGQKKKKKNNREIRLVKIDRTKQLKLDHLQEPDEEEN